MPRIALDSNVVIYAQGLVDDARNERAQAIVTASPPHDLVIPLQVIAETFRWLVKRAKQPREVAARSMQRWLSSFELQPTDEDVMKSAFELVTRHQFQVFDAVILAAAAEAGAQLLLSEDMQHGFRWRGVTIINPFAETPHPLLQELLKQEG